MESHALRFVEGGNRLIVLVLGSILGLCVALVIVDITLRKFGSSLGGTDEISGYVMALVTAWGMSYALSHHAHIRIELLLSRSHVMTQITFDGLYLLSLTFVTTLIVMKGWPVVEKSLLNQSTANTPLETPLWWVQVPWFLGWTWFALSCWIYAICFAVLLFKKRAAQASGLTRKLSQSDQIL
jgi:TRAP-type C4-dicarboxylate transport system permease small subunit